MREACNQPPNSLLPSNIRMQFLNDAINSNAKAFHLMFAAIYPAPWVMIRTGFYCKSINKLRRRHGDSTKNLNGNQQQVPPLHSNFPTYLV